GRAEGGHGRAQDRTVGDVRRGRGAVRMMADAFVKPPPLRRGDRVAVTSSSRGGPHALPPPYDAGLAVLRDELGLEVVEARPARMPADELARSPRLRAGP